MNASKVVHTWVGRWQLPRGAFPPPLRELQAYELAGVQKTVIFGNHEDHHLTDVSSQPSKLAAYAHHEITALL